jgi:hypothetical protein
MNTHIYYDIDIYNNDPNGTLPPKQLQFQELRNSPFLEDPDLYHCSIVRFHLDTGTLPIFIPQIQTGAEQVNPALTTYQITLNLGTEVSASEFVQFTSPAPHAPVGLPTVMQDYASEFYHCLSYQSFINDINTTFASLYALINTQGVLYQPPFFGWDGTTMIATLSVENNFLLNGGVIYFNSPLMKLFKSLPAVLNSHTDPNGKNWALTITQLADGSNTTSIGGVSMVQVSQEQSSIALWNPIKSIVFTTSLLPVEPCMIGVPNEQSHRLASVGNNSNFINVLTDFVVPVSPTNGYNPCIDYNPTSEYRLIDLRGTSPLNALDVSVYWKTHNNQLVPFYLHSNCSAHIKIMFRLKSFTRSFY